MKTRLEKRLAWVVGGVLLRGAAAGGYVFTHMSQTLLGLARAAALALGGDEMSVARSPTIPRAPMRPPAAYESMPRDI